MYFFLKPLSKIQKNKKWQFYRTRNQFRRNHYRINKRSKDTNYWKNIIWNTNKNNIHDVTLWDKDGARPAKSRLAPITPPQKLCFIENRAETYDFFKKLRRNLDNSIKKQITPYYKYKNGEILIASYYDYSKIEYISNTCAVILASEYQRAAHFLKCVPPTVNLNDWNNDVYTTLKEIGFFEIAGLMEDGISQFNENQLSQTKTMRIVCVTNADQLDKIDTSLNELFEYFEPPYYSPTYPDPQPIKLLLSGISEAITNVVHHAYPNDIKLPNYTFKKCWISACANKKTNLLTIAIYDHGVSIPVTYPKTDGMVPKIKEYITSVTSKVLHKSKVKIIDGAYIQAAMQYGNSRTGEQNRGKGLPQMYELLTKIGNGKLSIYSRYGWCHKNFDGDIRSSTEHIPLTGTLIEWSVNLGMAGAK